MGRGQEGEGSVVEVSSVRPDQVTPRLLAMVATGRSSLALVYGNRQQRFELFSPAINWERVLVARIKRSPVGYLTFQWEKTGPYALDIGDFRRVFGVVSGTWRWALHELLERRTWSWGFYVYGLKVLSQARRQGVATRLLEAARLRAGEFGATELVLDVFRKNESAIRFYLANGFHREGGSQPLAGLLPVLKMVTSVSWGAQSPR